MGSSPQFKDFRVERSDIVAVGATIDLAGAAANLAHNFVGVQFFADANGAAFATPGAGTVTITVSTVNNEPAFEAPPDNVISATAPTTVSYDASTRVVRAVPSGITTATHYRMVWTGYRS